MATKPKLSNYEQQAYKSQYQNKIDTALNNVTNRKDFKYDPLQDANYQALAKVYQKQGEQAAQNTLGDAAALNGGYGSSYAVTASQQARNDYNQMLASQIPSLQETAYNRYLNDYNMDVTALNALRDADDSAYNRYRDKVSDSQWKYGVAYQGYRDDVSDSQWKKSYDRSVYESNRDYNYQKSRDKVSDSQWAKEYALQKKAVADSRRSYTTGSGYVGSRSGGGGSSYSSNNSGSNFFDRTWNASNRGGSSNNTGKTGPRRGLAASQLKSKKSKKKAPPARGNRLVLAMRKNK